MCPGRAPANPEPKPGASCPQPKRTCRFCPCTEKVGALPPTALPANCEAANSPRLGALSRVRGAAGAVLAPSKAKVVLPRPPSHGIVHCYASPVVTP